MNYDEEYKRAKKGSGTFWKPNVGSYTVKILEEGTERTQEWEGKTIEKLGIPIDVDGDQYVWSVTKANSLISTYGQLMAVGKFKGKLKGETLTVVIMKQKGRDGREFNKVTIVEAAKLIAGDQ